MLAFVAPEVVQMRKERLMWYYSHRLSKLSEYNFTLLLDTICSYYRMEYLLSFDVRLCIYWLMSVSSLFVYSLTLCLASPASVQNLRHCNEALGYIGSH